MITNKELNNRIEKIQQKCRQNKIDAFLVTSDENLYYFTGKACFPLERPFILIIWADTAPTYFIPQLEYEHLKVIDHIENFKTYFEYPAPRDKSWKSVLGEILKNCHKIGTDLYTRSEIYNFLLTIVDVSPYDWAYSQRYVKSESEIEMMKDVAFYAKKSMNSFFKKIRKGDLVLDSLEVGKSANKKAVMDKRFKLDFYSTDFVSLAWPAPYSAEPHSIPDPVAPYNEGSHVMILSYRLNGYSIELERTFFTVKPTTEMKETFIHMMNARQIAFDMCKPGANLSDIDLAARNYFEEHGLLNNVIHRTGHGMGVSTHEGPFVAIGSETILKEGMTITIEPGLYFKGVGAYRHSDTVLITKDGFENLTDSPDKLEDLVILKGKSLKSFIKKCYLDKVQSSR